MTHVAMISRSYPTDEYQTSGIFEADYAHALARAGLQVSFLAVDMRSFRRKRRFGLRVEEKQGITIYRIDWPVGAIPKRLFYRLSFMALTKVWDAMLKREGRPDLIHTMFTDYAVLGAMMKEKTGVPLYMTENFSHINTDPIHPDLKRAAEYAYPLADVIQTVSPAFQKRLKNVFGVDSVDIPNLPDLRLFNHSDQPKEKLLVSTGLREEKGTPELVEAFSLLKDDYPALRLEIFGGGELFHSLNQSIKQKGLADRVFLHGSVDRSVIAETYKRASWFALCSHHETFGLAYVEAWASGLPVLGTRCGGPEHYFTEDNGILVPVGDIPAIENGLRALMQKEYDRQQIAQKAHEAFSEARIIGQIQAQYNRILKK
ncbi:MAG: glycosyltransferase [Peptoniphilaceae bacterium]|jgi:glycosyltransferase involved in cell wall biosynthesis